MKKKTWLQMGAALMVAWVSSYALGATSVKIISSAMRENDPTIMDVTYYVTSDSEKVDTRALAFQDGVRSFANVLRPETFLDGSVIGDGVAANTENKFSWRVSADWKIDLANVSIEVLAKPAGTGVVPLHWVTIPKNGDTPALRVSTTDLTDVQALDALYWLYADKDETLTLTDGVLSDANGTLVKGRELSGYRGDIGRHIYEKMGYQYLMDTRWFSMLSYARTAQRKALSSEFGYAWSGDGWLSYKQTVSGGLYLVVNLNTAPFSLSYLDAVPAEGWGDEYKTNKLVLRRIDASDGTFYYAGIFEVTEAQWYKVMGGDETTSTIPKGVMWNSIRGDANVYNWPTVTGVAQNSFMGELRAMTGLQTFDLPTRDEWEYAARAGVTTKWLCGDTPVSLGDYAWYTDNSGGATHSVGAKRPNAWGLYDVHGNAWEWCLNPMGSNREMCGGAYDNFSGLCSFVWRDSHASTNHYASNGFRVFLRAEGK